MCKLWLAKVRDMEEGYYKILKEYYQVVTLDEFYIYMGLKQDQVIGQLIDSLVRFNIKL